MITKLGLLFVYDLETATAVYRNRISPDPIFLAVSSPSTGGFYAVNRCGAPAERHRIGLQLFHPPRYEPRMRGVIHLQAIAHVCAHACRRGHPTHTQSRARMNLDSHVLF